LEPFNELAGILGRTGVRYLVIGVGGANYYAPAASASFVTLDRDLFLPPEPANELLAWRACESVGLDLWCSDESLDKPRDEFLAEQIVSRRALVRATDGKGLEVDLTLVMAGFEFETIWSRRKVFLAGDIEIPVARLRDIVASKAAAGRPKDRLFLATHEEALKELMKKEPR
jgi:hypothetical protein